MKDNKKELSSLDTIDIMRVINNADYIVPSKITEEIETIASAVESASDRFIKGGRLIYIGAGTSGRLGYLDAIELEPTYGVSPSNAFGILAGGKEAMFHAVEGAEDSIEAARIDLQQVDLTNNDIVIAIAASGNTPYTVSAAQYAQEIGALTIGISCTEENRLSKNVDFSINIVVGDEVVLGSTRMKAGSAQKMVLNMLSTGIMINVGRVYKNYMIYVQPTNKKLIERSQNIIADILNVNKEDAFKRLKEANNSIPIAIVMANKNMSYSEAVNFLENEDNIGQKIW